MGLRVSGDSKEQPTFTVREFIEFLKTLPPDIQVVERRYSDCGPMALSDWYVIEGFDTQSSRGYITRFNSDWREKDGEIPGTRRKFLYYNGN